MTVTTDASGGFTPSSTPDAQYQEIANNVGNCIATTLGQIHVANAVLYPGIDTSDGAAIISGALMGVLDFAVIAGRATYAEMRERIIVQMDNIGAQIDMEEAARAAGSPTTKGAA